MNIFSAVGGRTEPGAGLLRSGGAGVPATGVTPPVRVGRLSCEGSRRGIRPLQGFPQPGAVQDGQLRAQGSSGCEEGPHPERLESGSSSRKMDRELLFVDHCCRRERES